MANSLRPIWMHIIINILSSLNHNSCNNSQFHIQKAVFPDLCWLGFLQRAFLSGNVPTPSVSGVFLAVDSIAAVAVALRRARRGAFCAYCSKVRTPGSKGKKRAEVHY